jgi:hypothetical protein
VRSAPVRLWTARHPSALSAFDDGQVVRGLDLDTDPREHLLGLPGVDPTSSLFDFVQTLLLEQDSA